MKHIAKLAALAGAATLAACAYEDPRYIGHGPGVPYSTPAPQPPPSYRSSYYLTAPAAPPEPAPVYVAPAACYQPAHYDRWGYWVPARDVC